MLRPSLVILLASGCMFTNANAFQFTDQEGETPDEPGLGPDLEFAPDASPRLANGEFSNLAARIDGYFDGFGSKRLHVQLDRPMYKPGETVWLKTWSVMTRGLVADPLNAITYELLDPQGQVVETKQVQQQQGTATNDFMLAADVPGGKWTLRATASSGEVDERPFVVASYQTPRINKSLEFVREAYGPGDRVEALVELEHGTGGALSSRPVQVLLQIAGQTVLEAEMSTDKTGAVLVSAELPEELSSSDSLLTVLVEDAGITESISRSVPIVLADLQLAFFPEGGDLVADLPGRTYFEATNSHGEPADVEGFIVDDRGERVASFESVHDGMGRVSFTPEAGRSYTAQVTAPVGIKTAFELPRVHKAGCTVRAYDDFHNKVEEIRVGIRCSEKADVVVAGVLREATLDTAVISAGPETDTVVYLAPGKAQSDQQGAVQVTVFSPDLNPLAERLVYRNHGHNLQIDVTSDQEQYGPRDEVVLNIQTTDPSGEPLAAELALSVVDDAVISMADDKEGHMLSRLYLEPELIDSPKDPSFYFDSDEELAARSIDLVMGTKGHRRFEWTQVWDPPQLVAAIGTTGNAYGMGDLGYIDNAQMLGMAGGRDMEQDIPMMAIAAGEASAMVPPPAPPPEPRPVVAQDDPKFERKPVPVEAKEKQEVQIGAGEVFFGLGDGGGGRVQAGVRKQRVAIEDAIGFAHGAALDSNMHQGWAAVRVFPAPDYSAGFTGIRSDFRDTVHWEPSVRTDKEGRAEVRFYLSDSVTSFRVTTEGVGNGYAGHDEATLSSVLPVSIATRLPSAVSVGDRIDLPVTLSSTRGSDLDVSVVGEFFSSSLVAHNANGSVSLDAYGSDTYWIPIDIADGNESVSIRLSAEGGGLSDTLERELNVVPSGFPRSWSASGESDNLHRLHFQLDDVVPESLSATVTWHPSTVSTLIQGMEGMIRTPGGCFEQTSSSNWPNVAILNYLDAHDGDPRLVVQSSKALQVGYDKLTGYQVGAGGFETWGNGPGKEALSAFGLLQFHDMQKVFPVADEILSKDSKYLLAQRDGKGGFKNSGESAHGYGSAPPDILNGFITYALVETGHKASLKTEIDHQAKVAQRTEDPYVLALAVRSLQGGDHPGAHKASQKLADLQAEDGSFPGAKSSITRSYEANLLVESTALAALALMDTGKNRKAADKAAEWLVNNRQGAGTWGATQATALALFALTRHAEVSSVPQSAGVISLEVNGTIVGSLSYDAEQTDALTIDGWEDYLLPGDNSLVLRQEDGNPLPFTVDVSWTSITPTTSPGAELSLQTELERTEMGMGDTVRMTARIDNQAGRIVPSPIARIGIPAGLEAQTWQLEQLQERGEIAFFETRPREVTLYWDGIHTDDSHEIALDLVAAIPGSYTAPASSAYPYYNDDEKAWDAGVKVEISK